MSEFSNLRNPVQRVASVDELHPYVARLTAVLKNYQEIKEPISSTPHVTSDGEVLNVFSPSSVHPTTVNVLVAQLVRLSLYSGNSLRQPTGEVRVLVPQPGYTPPRWQRMTSGATLRDLNLREHLGLVGTLSVDKRVPVTVNDIIEPEFLRFGRIERALLHKTDRLPCYVLVLKELLGDAVVTILEEIRRDCPQLVTMTEFMARKTATEGKTATEEVGRKSKTLEELEPNPLALKGSRRSLKRALESAGVDTTGMTSTANVYRLSPRGGMESRAALINSGRSGEIDLVGSYPTCVVAAISSTFQSHHDVSEDLRVHVRRLLRAGPNLVSQINSVVVRSMEDGVLPLEMQRWDSDRHWYVNVDTRDAVKKLMTYAASTPSSRGGLSSRNVRLLRNEIPLLRSFLLVWRKLHEHVISHYLKRLKEDGHDIPQTATQSQRISLVLTNIESRNMRALALMLKEFLSRKGHEIKPGDTKYRNDGLALSKEASALFAENTGWVGELNDEIKSRCGDHIGFRIAFKKIKSKHEPSPLKKIKVRRIPKAVLEMRRAV